MSKLLAWLEVQGNRALLYRAALILGPLLVVAGVVSSGTWAQILGVAGVLLGVGGNGLAARHTSRKAR